jgi:hypothetical protein
MDTANAIAMTLFTDESPLVYDVSEDCEGTKALTGLRQPWKAFWPPGEVGDTDRWHDSEFPEVLSWKFDANLPFDRPWRQWTRTSLAKQEETILPVKFQSVERSRECESIRYLEDYFLTLRLERYYL